MGAIQTTDPTLGTRDPTPIRHIITVTPRIAEELPSTFTSIGTTNPDISSIGITAAIVIGEAECEVSQCFRVLFGGRTRTRTWDPLIKSKVLSPVIKRHHTTATDADPHFFIES